VHPRLLTPRPRFAPPPGIHAGAAAFKNFQDQMRFLLNKVQKDGEPAPDNFDIGAQVQRGRGGAALPWATGAGACSRGLA
jgi:hypothetical protein